MIGATDVSAAITGSHLQQGMHPHGRRAEEASWGPMLSSGPPYARLNGCPAAEEGLVIGLGLVLDVGFVTARGGREPALLAAASAVSRANLLLEGQIGVRFVLRRVIVNEGEGGSVEATGPNEFPSQGRGTRTCAGYQQVTLSNGGNPVLLQGPSRALNELSKWSGAYGDAPETIGEWMLLTDCFPPVGTNGLATVGLACRSTTMGEYTDSGLPGTAEDCVLMAATGNCGAASFLPGLPACTLGSDICLGNSGVVSDGPDMWRTLAHELVHSLGGQHTFGEGGLMAYTAQIGMHDNEDICPRIAETRASGKHYPPSLAAFPSSLLATMY